MGSQITIRCSLFAKNLPMPLERTLAINVREAQTSQ